MPRNNRIAEARRAQVKQAAVECVVETGYGELSVKQIAAKAGVSTGVLYHHFQNKEEILIQALGAAFSETDRRLREAVDHGAPGSERLATYLRLSASIGANDFSAVSLLLNAIGQIGYSPAIQERLARLFASFRRYANTVLQATAGETRLTPAERDALAGLIVAVGVGMAVQWAAEPGAVSPDDCGAELERLFASITETGGEDGV